MSRTSFSISVVGADATASVLVQGELDLATAPELARALTSCLAERYAVVEVDMQAVEFMACAGLNVLLQARRAAEAAGVRLDVTHPSRVVDRLLTLTATRALLRADELGVPQAVPAG